jgi:hypothetical protein
LKVVMGLILGAVWQARKITKWQLNVVGIMFLIPMEM